MKFLRSVGGSPGSDQNRNEDMKDGIKASVQMESTLVAKDDDNSDRDEGNVDEQSEITPPVC
jgi:hypothetical protein